MSESVEESRSGGPGPGDEPGSPGDEPGSVAKLLRLGLIVVIALALSAATGALPTVAVMGAVVAMIMLHELGHLVMAKVGGMKVTEYFLGFGPRLWSIRRGETEYGVKALPLGGYVKIPGMSSLEEVDPADEPRTYREQSFPRRLGVAVAGSAMHFLIAFVLMLVLLMGVGLPDYSRPERAIGTLSRLQGGPSPAQQAKLRVGDRILAVDGKPLARWNDLPPYIRARTGKAITLRVQREGHPGPLDLTAVPIEHTDVSGQKVGFIGVGPAIPRERVGPVLAVGRAGKQFGDDVVLTVKALGSFFSPGRLQSYGGQLFGDRAPKSAAEESNRFFSPVGIVRVAGQAADSGAVAVLAFLIALNVGVGVFNLVPLLPLDGGHVAIAIYERIRSRRATRYHADARKLVPVTAAVVGVLALIVVSSLWLDITRPMSNPFQ